MDRRLILERATDAVSAWNRGDADGVVEHAVEDVIWQDVSLPMPVHGRDAMRAAAQAYMTAFPDLEIEVTTQTFEGSRLVQEWTATGTHRGELMGAPPTGRVSKVYGATVATFDEEGRIIEGTMYWNPLAMLHQLGLLPAQEPQPAATAS